MWPKVSSSQNITLAEVYILWKRTTTNIARLTLLFFKECRMKENTPFKLFFSTSIPFFVPHI